MGVRDINEPGGMDCYRAKQSKYAAIVEEAERARGAETKRRSGTYDALWGIMLKIGAFLCEQPFRFVGFRSSSLGPVRRPRQADCRRAWCRTWSSSPVEPRRPVRMIFGSAIIASIPPIAAADLRQRLAPFNEQP